MPVLEELIKPSYYRANSLKRSFFALFTPGWVIATLYVEPKLIFIDFLSLILAKKHIIIFFANFGYNIYRGEEL